MFNLTEKTALVTGATGGLGREIAKALHAQGAHVVISGTKEPILQNLEKELGNRVTIAPCNLSDIDAVESLVPNLTKKGINLDILVNNAGLTRDGLAMRMKNEDWDIVLQVNLKAAFLLSRSCLRGMMKRRSGRIINITSVVGVAGNPGQSNYCASKAGLIGMSKSLAQETASRGITVNCVAPGFIKSPMTATLNEKQQEAILSSIPTGKMGNPEDIAAACVYLASGEAQYVTGQTIHVNGGMMMI